MMRSLYLFSVILLVSASAACAQQVNVDRIVLTYDSFQDVKAGATKNEPGAVLLDGNKSLTWQSADGAPIKTFHVSETIGEWADLNTPGSVTYEVTDGFGSATIRIYRTNATVIIKILMSNEAEDVFELPIAEYQVIH
jgi:hypothetical protein